MPGQPRLGAGGHLFAEGAGAVVERDGELAGDGGGAGGCALGPGHVVPAELGQAEALQAAVQDAGDGPGAVHRRGGDLVDQRADVVPGELGGAEPLLQGLAGVLALVPPGFGFGEPGLDLLVDLRVQGLPDGGGPQVEQVAGSAGPFLGLADLLGGGQVAGVAVHDAGEHGFGGGLLVGLLAGRGGVAGDDVRGVGLAAAGHADVQGLPGQGVGDQEVGGVDGAALGDVHVAGVGEFGAGGRGRTGAPGTSRSRSRPSRCRRTSASGPRNAVILRVSRLVSLRPPASISVFSRARIRSPTPAWLPSASAACGRPDGAHLGELGLDAAG